MKALVLAEEPESSQSIPEKVFLTEAKTEIRIPV